MFGHELRNISVRFLARGGVFVGGGVIAGLLPFLPDGTFERAFRGSRNAADVVSKLRQLGVRCICIFTGDRLDV